MKPPVNILMDDRERSAALFQALTAMEGVAVNVRRLALGDYQVDGRLLFERKTLPDFALSVIDGRLFGQMTRLSASTYKGILILEGSSRDLDRAGVRREALQGALIFTSLILGIPVLRSMEPGETGRLMVYAARQVRSAATGGLHRAGRRPKGKRKRQLYILQGLPGVGPTRAERLLAHFGNVRNVFSASSEALLSVDGIGNDTAQRIKYAVREAVVPYGVESELILDI